MKKLNSILKAIIKLLPNKSASYIIDRISFYKLALKSGLYNYRKNDILNKLKKKDKITIVFFVYKLGMWKYDGLIKLLIKNERFNPIIVPSLRETDDYRQNLLEQDAIINYCKMNNIPYMVGYNKETHKFADINTIQPDIIIYTQPYNAEYKDYKIERFKRDCLFLYTPYGLSVSDTPKLYNTYLMNIAYKIFTANSLESKILRNQRSLKHDNTIVTGAPFYDDIKNAKISKTPWRNNSKLKIIWAPHHSIDEKFSFSNSTFEMVCNYMVELAKKYKDDIEICFKPHPVLFDRLIEKWGYEEARKYYTKWNEMPNTFICYGDYKELFAFSDGMIHDCCSFVGEYLFVNKPVLYINKSKDIPKGINNEFGKMCYNQHYHAYGPKDIDFFINQILLKKDPLLFQRTEFIKQYLLPPNNNSVAENMLIQIERIFT